VDRLREFLAVRLERSDRDPGGAITVDELRREILPYPVCRQAVEFATKAEYDLAMLELLSDPATLRIGSEELREAIERERDSPEPGVAFLTGHAEVPLEPGPRLREGSAPADGAGHREAASTGGRDAPEEDAGPATDGGTPPGPEGTRGASQGTAAEDAASGTDVPGEDASPSFTGGCWSCDRELPERPDLRYCPYCGSDQRSPECGACGAGLETEWSYCPVCGRSTDA